MVRTGHQVLTRWWGEDTAEELDFQSPSMHMRVIRAAAWAPRPLKTGILASMTERRVPARGASSWAAG
jgi:hypothetical protein